MKKTIPWLCVIGLMVSIAVARPAAAQAPVGYFVSEITCTNPDTSNALLSLVHYPENSTAATIYEDPTPRSPGASVVYYLPNGGGGAPTSLSGSTYVNSDSRISCYQKTVRTDGPIGTTGTPARIGEANGLRVYTDSADTLYVPQVMRNFASTWNSYISIQNMGLTDASVTVAYTKRTGSAANANENITIPARSSRVLYQANNLSLPTDDNGGFMGSAIITTASTGSRRIVASVAFYNSANIYQNSQFHSYNAFNGGATKLVVPRFVRNYYGFNSGISIQNLGNSSITVNIAFTFPSIPNGTYNFTSPLIAPGAVYAPYAKDIAAIAAVDIATVEKRFGSAIVTTSGASIIAIVNEDNRGTCWSAACPPIPVAQVGYGSTYSALPDDGSTNTATNVVVFPHVPRNIGGLAGGWQVSNLTNTSTTCTMDYEGEPNAKFDVNALAPFTANSKNFTLGANASVAVFLNNNNQNQIVNLPNSFNKTVTISCSAVGARIQGISNSSYQANSSYYGDSFTTANGFSK